jgi:hypothetical protein
VPYAKFDDPQSLNLYACVWNNPLERNDPDGHCFEDACIVEGLVAGGIAFSETPEGQALEQEGEEAAERYSGEIESGVQRGWDFAGDKLANAGKFLEKQAEEYLGTSKNSGQQRILEGEANGAQFRVPDFLNSAKNFIAEVKDTAKLNLTNQLKDFMSFAKTKGLSFNLLTRDGTKLSEPLLKALEENKATIYQFKDGKWVDMTKQLYATIRPH